MHRRTKIICTLGPASSDRETIRQLVEAGMDVARLNFSHGTHEDHERNMRYVREAAEEVGRPVTILQDLQGPKIRVGQVEGGSVLLHKGQELVLTPEPMDLSTAERIFVSYKALASDVQAGGRILIDDGLLELEVKEAKNGEVVTEVIVGGPLRSRKGVNLPDIRTSAPSLTPKDLRDLEFGLEHEVDCIALSFVRDPEDVSDLLERVRPAGRKTSVIAKIEKPEAVRQIDQIIDRADGIMVARGDLGIEMPMAQVPRAQKEIIRRCLIKAKPVITATQMLESMIENPRPTRAEATDVANAVLDGSDAVMLSGETAVGAHPVRVVETMAQIILEAEQYRERYEVAPQPQETGSATSEDITDSVSYTACQLARQLNADVIACLTASGATARSIARHRPGVPIYAFTDDERIVGQLGLLWGTRAFSIPFQPGTDEGVSVVQELLAEKELVESGSLIVVTAGMPLPAKGRTNMVNVSRV